MLSLEDDIALTIIDQSTNVKTQKTYQCSVTKISPEYILQCDTQNYPIKSIVLDLHLSSWVSETNNLLVIKMKDWENDNKVFETPISPIPISNSNKGKKILVDFQKELLPGLLLPVLL